ncbi:hypothetical protein D9V86_02210 [Bacteroidetes/Chlorobi group bacterium ChocPot_Mid]|jgi:hypothetical protein|nr:MAG: hypothetical protein D9V86_02210 [Bacteroidetes/Chlorobi group bacterium ChocPot_Mid]
MRVFINSVLLTSNLKKIAVLMIFFIFGFANFLVAQQHLAPAKDFTPKINKYIFINSGDAQTNKQDNQDSKNKKTQSVQSDSLDNSFEISYSPFGEPVKMVVTVKEKDKKITISLYNLIGNKVADVYNGVPGVTEKEIDNFPKEIEKLSNGVYLCVLQGYNYRLMKKFTISR